jgi:hypothetical protein
MVQEQLTDAERQQIIRTLTLCIAGSFDHPPDTLLSALRKISGKDTVVLARHANPCSAPGMSNDQ